MKRTNRATQDTQLFVRGDTLAAASAGVVGGLVKEGVIEKDPEHKNNAFVITGYSGNGFTCGVLGAIICADLRTNKTNPGSACAIPRAHH